jgi:hypothetical protein
VDVPAAALPGVLGGGAGADRRVDVGEAVVSGYVKAPGYMGHIDQFLSSVAGQHRLGAQIIVESHVGHVDGCYGLLVDGAIVATGVIEVQAGDWRARDELELEVTLVETMAAGGAVGGPPLVFLDTETTGTDPERHHVFEVAMIRPGPPGAPDEAWNLWIEGVSLATADPAALRINHFYEREPDYALVKGIGVGSTVPPTGELTVVRPGTAARIVAKVTSGCHIVGAVPSFDATFLTALLRLEGLVPAWHYHLCDVEALVAGYLRIEPPWKSYDLYRAVGVDPDIYEQHTALGDARMARDVYRAVMDETLRRARKARVGNSSTSPVE